MKHTDQQINIALAKAIGWKKIDIRKWRINFADGTKMHDYIEVGKRPFSYQNSAVIWPIAAKYVAFPIKVAGVWRDPYTSELYATPELAVAMTVIGMQGVKI